MKEQLPSAELQRITGQLRERVTQVMDITDLKLSEIYWGILSKLVSENQQFTLFVFKINIWELLVKQFEMFLPSLDFQKSIIFIVLECAFKRQYSKQQQDKLQN